MAAWSSRSALQQGRRGVRCKTTHNVLYSLFKCWYLPFSHLSKLSFVLFGLLLLSSRSSKIVVLDVFDSLPVCIFVMCAAYN